MHWRTLLSAVALGLTALAFGGLPASASASADTPVLAFYYPWYNPENFHRGAMWDVPVNPYQSDSRSTIERQVREARGAGVTGFISSWMGKGNRTDKNLATLLEVSKGTDFASTIYFETGQPGLSSQGEIVDALRYVMATHGSHPNWAQVGGRPAIFFWNPSAAGGVDFWRGVRAQVDPSGQWHWNVETDRPDSWLEVFDGIHLFSAASWTSDATATYKNLRSKVEAVGARTGQPKVWTAGVAPGWDNSRQGNPTQVVVGRDNGSYYSRRWESAIASEPGAITITSWNEWGEGTAIEPGSSYGNLYLDITRTHSGAYRQALTASAPTGFGFKLGFKALADQITRIAGQPLEEEHYGANGDSLQQTTTGLMVWRKADNWTAFTNGARSWVNGPYGVRERGNEERFPWEGS
ncbi:MAG: endo-1,3-alpha-glucanase family glycosylhydrolase [Chloroflexota bacterium]